MPDALFQNRIDAVWAVEPFLTIMLKTGKARIFAQPYLKNIPGMDITAYIAKESWLKANPDVAARFKRAIDKATMDLVKRQERRAGRLGGQVYRCQARTRRRYDVAEFHDRVQYGEPQGQSRSRREA